jgi:hypothetical protein
LGRHQSIFGRCEDEDRFAEDEDDYEQKQGLPLPFFVGKQIYYISPLQGSISINTNQRQIVGFTMKNMKGMKIDPSR